MYHKIQRIYLHPHLKQSLIEVTGLFYQTILAYQYQHICLVIIKNCKWQNITGPSESTTKYVLYKKQMQGILSQKCFLCVYVKKHKQIYFYRIFETQVLPHPQSHPSFRAKQPWASASALAQTLKRERVTVYVRG